MDLAHAAQDQVFLQFEQPHAVELLNEVEKLGHGSRLADESSLPRGGNESTPLIAKAGKNRLYVDGDVDLEALDRKLHEEERDAVEEDSHAMKQELLRQEATSLVLLSIPITMTLVLELLPLVIVAMLIGNVSGADSPQVLAALSLSDFFQGQLNLNVVNGLGAAVASTCAQSFGAKQHRQLWIYAQAGLLACAYCSVPLLLLCLNASSILQLMGQDPELTRLAGEFILIGSASLPFFMVYTVARSALQAQNIAAPFVIVSIASYCVSLPIAYVVGYYTSLGYIGVALSTIISSIIKTLAVVPVLLNNEIFVQSWPGWQWKEANHLALKLWPLTGGSVLMATFQTASFNMFPLFCGLLPNAPVVMTANSIASTLATFSFMPMMGLCAGGVVRIGNALGASHARRASVASAVLIASMLVVSATGVAMCWWFASSYAKLYTDDVDTVELTNVIGHHLLRFIPVVGCVFAAQSIFQACGAQWLCAKLNFAFLFALGLPLEYLLGFVFGQGVFGLWDGILWGSVCFVAASIVWFYNLDWKATAHEVHQNSHLHVERGRALSETAMSFD